MKTEHDIKLHPSTLENIDTAFFNYVDELKIRTETNDGWIEWEDENGIDIMEVMKEGEEKK